MRRTNGAYLQGLVFAPITMVVLLLLEKGSVISGKIVTLLLQNELEPILDVNLVISIVFLTLPVLIFITRRKILRVTIGSILGFSSCLFWYSTTSLWLEYNISPLEQKMIAVVLLGLSLWLLVSRSPKQKRKNFSEIVRRETIHKQKGRCKRCRRRLQAYGADADHKDNNRANNRASNCVILCTPCHRRKHFQ